MRRIGRTHGHTHAPLTTQRPNTHTNLHSLLRFDDFERSLGLCCVGHHACVCHSTHSDFSHRRAHVGMRYHCSYTLTATTHKSVCRERERGRAHGGGGGARHDATEA